MLRYPLIISTDVGGDVDDAVTLVCAAAMPELRLVVTADEHGGRRARLARHLLDQLGRDDVAVVAGADLSDPRYWVCDGLVPDTVPDQPRDLIPVIDELACAAVDAPLAWVGCGPLTDLAHVLRERPELNSRLIITQMGGCDDSLYRKPGLAEHNFRLDPQAARYVLRTAENLRLVTSDVTFRDEISIGADHPIYRALADPSAPAWATLVARHFQRWERDFGYTSKQHDPLTLTAAMGEEFVGFGTRGSVITEDARMIADPAGTLLTVSTGADYTGFMAWLVEQLVEAGMPQPS